MQSISIVNLVTQWQQTPRLRVGGMVVLLIIFFLGLDSLTNYKVEIEQDYIAVEKRHQKLQAIAGQSWQKSAENTRALRIEFERNLWQAETKGLAQAKIQSWLNGKVKIDGLKTSVSSATELAESEQLWQVNIDIKGVMNWQQLIKLLGQVELNTTAMIVDALSIQSTKKALRVEMQLTSVFQASVTN